MTKKKIVVVGAGPGGLTAAMLLAHKGYDVEIFEKQDYVGGRNGAMKIDGFTFDLGPTFLMMLFILEEMFEMSGRKLEDYLELKSIEPMYRLVYGDGKEFFPSRDKEYMKKQIEEMFPGNFKGYEKFMAYEKEKFARLVPCLQIPYSSPLHFLRTKIFKALPYLDAHVSLFKHLGKFFDHDDLKTAFTFQAKYLGMSPWNCPGIFSIIPYIEHSGGIYHPIGGLNQISHAMAKIIGEDGGRIHLNTGVKEILIEKGKATGVKLENGDTVKGDYVVINADFGHAMNQLVKKDRLKRWTPEKLEKKLFSCSTFMLYLGVDKIYDIPHHSIVFATDYRKNVHEIADLYELSREPSFYVQNAGVTDPTLAPEGQSTIYVLVPAPNNRSDIDWNTEQQSYREKIIDLMETRAGLIDLRKHIVTERIINPLNWEKNAFVYKGATFNLGHSIPQMLYFRPHNEFEEFKNCYIVGGGTHPGSGLPTIYESGRIAADLIEARDNC